MWFNKHGKGEGGKGLKWREQGCPHLFDASVEGKAGNKQIFLYNMGFLDKFVFYLWT